MQENITENSLLAALKLNFEHARHVEHLRERCAYLYWAAWGAASAVFSSSITGRPNYPLSNYAWVFLFLCVLSYSFLIATLKWNMEFTNHMRAISQISIVLGLNEPVGGASNEFIESERKKFFWNSWFYPEFKGYVALPIQVLLPLNASVIISLVYCAGAAVSSFFFLDGLYSSQLLFVWKLLIAFVVGLVALVLCIYFFRLTQVAVEARTRKHEPKKRSQAGFHSK